MTEVFISGPAGRIQALYNQPEFSQSGSISKLALILPPHPRYGGTMNNRTVYALSRAFLKIGFSTLRINFRGVSMSEGSFSRNLDDELLKDAAAAITWLQEHQPIVSEFWIAGFSFGAWMSMNLVMRRPEVTGFVAVSPPIERYDFSFMYPCSVPGLIIQGEKDQFNSEKEVSYLCEKLSGRVNDIQYKVVKNADHRFSDPKHLSHVYNLALDYISSHIARHNLDTEHTHIERDLEKDPIDV